MRKETQYGYPNPLASESEKDSTSYGLAYFRSMFSDWTGENEALLQSRRTRWQLARDYAGGKQSTGRYKDLLEVEGDESYMNLDWSIVPIIPKFIDIIVNSLTNVDYDLTATAIDPVATDKRKADELKMRTQLLVKDFAKKMEAITALPLTKDSNLQPQTSEEIDLFMQLTYKQAAEIAIEQGLKLAMTINEWKEIAKRVVRDLVVIGIGAVKTELDHRGVIIRYVDPMYLVTTFSDNPDFSKITHAGEMKRITISELKAEVGDQFTPDIWADIARNWVGKNGNAKKFRTVPNIINGIEYYDYDHFFVDVLDAQFIVPNSIIQEKKYNKYGGYSINRKKDTYTPPSKSKYAREIIKTDYECKYSGKWIVGTDYMYDYGKAKNQVRAKSSLHKTKLDFIIYSPDIDFMKNQSLCERMMPFGDQIQLTHLKLQQLAAKARPKGMAMEVGSIENVPKGKGGIFTPLEIQDIYNQTGVYYYRYLQDDGAPSQARPITELSGGIGGALNELLALYQHNLSLLRDVTGVNEARDGNTPSKDSAVGVAKLNLLASNNATRGINDAYLNIFRRTAESAILMIQDLVQYNKPYQGYVRAIGEMNMEAISVTSDVSLYEFGLIIEAEPTAEEKEQLNMDINQSIAQKELRIEDSMMIRSIKNVKLANQMLILRRKKYAEERALEAQQASEYNAQQQQQSIMAKAQADLQKAQGEAQIEIEKEAQLLELQDQYDARKHVREMEKITLTNDGKTEVAEINNEQKVVN